MANLSALTSKQRQIYEFIHEKIDSRGYGPTVREIGTAFDIKSPNGVMCHLKALEKKGLIKREGFSARAIQIIDRKPRSEPDGLSRLPLMGAVAAGSPIEAVEQDEQLNFSDLFGVPGAFALHVRGQSMIEDHIDDGDFAIIKPQETAENGQTVVVKIDGEATLKRFYQKKDHIRLEPANSTMQPIIVHSKGDAQILGVLVGVVRKC